MLMIVGLVLFIIVSLAIHFSKGTKNGPMENENFDVQPIKKFVDGCIERLAKDAIKLLGDQGGYIYKSQGGSVIDYQESDETVTFKMHAGSMVSYNILPPKFKVGPYESSIPEYPWNVFPYDISSDEKTFKGYFGISHFPPLNESEGINSFQQQIEWFIDENIQKCIGSFESFRDLSIEADFDEISTSIFIGNTNLNVRSKIPITIKNIQTGGQAKLDEFSTTLNIGLKEFHEFIKSAIREDISNIEYDLGKITNDRFEVEVMRETDGDDIIRISDKNSRILDEPLTYHFARKNRFPALFYTKEYNNEFQMMQSLVLNDILKNDLEALDPDEDELFFSSSPSFPLTLDVPSLDIRLEVSDGKLTDYQNINIISR